MSATTEDNWRFNPQEDSGSQGRMMSSELSHVNTDGPRIFILGLLSVMGLGHSPKGFLALCFQPIIHLHMYLATRESL